MPTPTPNVPSASFRYQTYPRFVSFSRVKKNVCGGGNAATAPPLASATIRRFCAFTRASVVLIAPPNWCVCGWPPVSRHVTRGVRSVENPFNPASYLYATHGSFVLAAASIRTRFVPLYTVNCRSPEKIPIDNPGNVTMRLAPSVFTLHDVVRNDESARRISDGVRGGPSVRFGISQSLFLAWPPRPPRPPAL